MPEAALGPVRPRRFGHSHRVQVHRSGTSTPRERVWTAFAHEKPDRVPAWCGASEGFGDMALRRLEFDDIDRSASPSPRKVSVIP